MAEFIWNFYTLNKRPWLVTYAIGALAVGLRLVGISRYGFDGDELFSLQAASSTWSYLLSTAIYDKSHPPLYYATLKLWLFLGPPEENWVRLLSTFFGLALVPLAFSICREIQLRRADAVLVLLLVASNDLLVFYSQHARMFALLELTSTISILMFIRFSRVPSSRNFILLTFANVVLVYSHYWGWLIILSELFIGITRKNGLIKLVTSTALVGLCFSLWAIAILHGITAAKEFTTQISWMGLGESNVAEYAYLFGSLNGPIDFPHSTAVGIILFMTPVIIVFSKCVRNRVPCITDVSSPPSWLILVLTPLVGTSVLSYMIGQNLWGTRHLSMVAVSYFVLIGLSIAALPTSAFWKMVIRCSIVAWAIISCATSLAATDRKLHWEVLARAIAARGDIPVFVSDRFVLCPLEFHLGRFSNQTFTVTEEPHLNAISADRFWFVYRDINWRGQNPRIQLEASNKQIVSEITTATPWQGVTAVLAQGATDAATSSSISSNPEERDPRAQPTRTRQVQLERIRDCYRPR